MGSLSDAIGTPRCPHDQRPTQFVSGSGWACITHGLVIRTHHAHICPCGRAWECWDLHGKAPCSRCERLVPVTAPPAEVI